MQCAECHYQNPPSSPYCKRCKAPLRRPSTASTHNVTAIVYAGFKVRLLASFLDILVIASGLILIALIFASIIAYSGRDQILNNEWAIAFFYAAIIALSASYYILMESGADGATLGKSWLNIKVLNTHGERLTTRRATARFVLRFLSHLPLQLGFLIQPFTPRKQALHDLLSHTLVVYSSDSKKVSIYASLLVIFFALSIPAIALFSTAGIPLYQQHVQQVQLNNGLEAGKAASLAVAQFYIDLGRLPADIYETGKKFTTSPHVAGIGINQTNGQITVRFSEVVRKGIKNKSLLFTPAQAADRSIIWKCSSTDIEARLLPEGCK
jgi:uncharacterized RDD family membrane protein YckC